MVFPPHAFFKADAAFNRIAGLLTGWMVAFLLVRQRSDQESLRDMDEKFRALVEESPVGNFLVQDWRFVYVNNRLSRLFGYSKEELFALNSVLDLSIRRIIQKQKKYYDTSATETPAVQILISGDYAKTARPCISRCIYSIPRTAAGRRRWAGDRHL